MIYSILLIFLLGCSSQHTDYPANAVKSFMISCELSSGGDTEYCSYMLSEIQKEYSYDKFYELGVKLQFNEQLPDDFTEFISKTSKKYFKERRK
jgi:hypothetical protein